MGERELSHNGGYARSPTPPPVEGRRGWGGAVRRRRCPAAQNQSPAVPPLRNKSRTWVRMAWEPWHSAWLSAHPMRSEDWLRDRLRDGFDVHHIDGDKGNNDPANLVLIEHADHMRLHGVGIGAGRLVRLRPVDMPRRPPKVSAWESKRRRLVARLERQGLPVPDHLLP